MPKPEDVIWEYDGHYENDHYSATSIRAEEISDLNVPAIIISNFKFENVEGGSYQYVPGLSFLAPIAPPFYHAMIDVVGEYELIKKYYPSVSLRLCSNDSFEEYTSQIERRNSKYISSIMTMYGYGSMIDAYNTKGQNYHFEEVIVLPQRSIWSQDRIVPLAMQNSIKKFHAIECLERRPLAMFAMMEKIKPLLSKTVPLKLYASRIDAGSGGVSQRDEGNEQEIVDFFRSQGYRIVNMSELPLLEQFNLFYNATEIAGIKGSNLFGAVFADPGTPTYVIHNSGSWDYPFETYFNAVGLDYIPITKSEAGSLEVGRVPESVILSHLKEYF